MNEEYLWDGSGERDEAIAALESALGQFRYRGPRAAGRSRRIRAFAAIAAALAIAAIGGWALERQRTATSWRISFDGRDQRTLHAGQIIETRASIRARMESSAAGQVDLEPGSRVRLVEERSGMERFSLQRGTIHAFIWVPPRTFVVETPSAQTVDLGCRYTLHIRADGSGELNVETGWVAFEWRGVESFIPAGAICETRPGRGPGVPRFDDASPAFAAAIERFDHGDPSALNSALSAARPRDALSLWHLMTRTNGVRRAEVFDRFAQAIAMPSTVTRDAILRGDPKALDAAWNALNLGNTSWWREWKRQW